MVAGAAVRLEQFGSRRSLWLDEALVANNVVGRSFAGLVHPLAGQQGAPIGWLWAERLMVVLLGDNEYALRLVPLAAGIAALVLLHRVALRVVGPWPAALATCLLASAPEAVRYSVEVKQYSSDLAWGLVLVLLALRAAARPSHHSVRSPWTLAAWGGVGALAVWCSHPAVLVLASSAAVLIVAATDRRRFDDCVAVLVASVPWVLSFGVDWLVSLRRLGGNSYLRSYWAAGFAPKPLRTIPASFWAVHATIRLMSDPGALPVAGLAAVIVVAGLSRAVARRPLEAALVTAPLVVGIGAGAVGVYPLDGRIALWTLPVLLLGLASAAVGLAVWVDTAAARATGMDRAVHLRRPRGLPDGGMVVALCCIAALVQAPVRQVGSLAHDPAIWVDLRPMLQQIHDRAEPTDQLWVHDNDAPSAAFYARSTGVDPDGVVSAAAPGGSCPAPGEPARVAAAVGCGSCTATAPVRRHRESPPPSSPGWRRPLRWSRSSTGPECPLGCWTSVHHPPSRPRWTMRGWPACRSCQCPAHHRRGCRPARSEPVGGSDRRRAEPVPGPPGPARPRRSGARR